MATIHCEGREAAVIEIDGRRLPIKEAELWLKQEHGDAATAEMTNITGVEDVQGVYLITRICPEGEGE